MAHFGWIGTLGALAIGAAYAVTSAMQSPTKDGVGTKPGDVGRRLDSDAAAIKRGHQLAMFGMG